MDDRTYRWVLIFLLWIIGFLNYVDRVAIFSVFPLLRQEMGVTNMQMALVGTVFLWTYSACSPLAGYIGDRFHRKDVIISSFVLFSLVTFASGLVHTGNQLIILRSLLGVSEALFIPTAVAYVADFHPDTSRSFAIAIMLTSAPAGAAVGGAYGGFMGEHYSWRMAFFLLGVMGVLLALILAPLLRKTSKGGATAQSNVPEQPLGRRLLVILSTPTVLIIMFIGFAQSLTSWPIMNWMPLYVHEKFGLSLTRAGFMGTFPVQITVMVATLIGGAIGDRWARRNRTGRMYLQAIGCGIVAPAMLAMGFAPSAMLLIGNMIVYGIGRGSVDCNFMPTLCYVVPATGWATTYGILNLANTLGGSIGVLMVGAMKSSWGTGMALSATSVAVFVAFALALLGALKYLSRDIARREAQDAQAVVETSRSMQEAD